MKRRVAGVVEAITSERPGAQEIGVRLDVPAREGTSGLSNQPGGQGMSILANDRMRVAINLLELTGRVEIGERVILNTVAVELGLGTGGRDFVVAILRAQEPDVPAPGHILKLRYTPLQTPVLAAEAPESPYHDRISHFETLNEMPVVCAQLHSQIPAIVAGARWALHQHGGRILPRIAYLMTDGAALPLSISKLIPQLQGMGWLSATITAGQAFGGDYECVNLYSALATAYTVVGADLVIVCQGPGNVGTGTPLGFSGIEQGQAINAVASLGGMAIAAARVSFADPRTRHWGISHHTVTALQKVARASALVALPRLHDDEMQCLLETLEETGLEETHQPIFIMADGALEWLQASGLTVTTMGRDIDEDRAFFLSACAAGVLAGQILEARQM